MIVTPINIPVSHDGKVFIAGEEFEIDRAGYDRIANHLEIIDESDESADKQIEKMTVAELQEFALRNEIDLGGATKKQDIIAVIQAVIGGGGDDIA